MFSYSKIDIFVFLIFNISIASILCLFYIPLRNSPRFCTIQKYSNHYFIQPSSNGMIFFQILFSFHRCKLCKHTILRLISSPCPYHSCLLRIRELYERIYHFQILYGFLNLLLVSIVVTVILFSLNKTFDFLFLLCLANRVFPLRISKWAKYH